MVARRACRDGIKVLQLHLRPVNAGICSVCERQHGIPVADVVRHIEVDVLEVLDIRRTCTPAVDVQGIICCLCLVSIVNGANGSRCECRGLRAEVDGVARGHARAVCKAAVDIMERAARDVHGIVFGIARAVRMGCVDRTVDCTTREVQCAARNASRRSCVDDASTVDIACDASTSGDVDHALCDAACCTCSGKGCTVNIARDHTACDLCGVLRRTPRFCAHLGTIGVGDSTAGDGDGILLGITSRYADLVVLDKSAVRRCAKRAACDGQLIVLHLVADLCASRPRFAVRAVGCGVGRCIIVLKLVAFERDVLRRIRSMTVSVNDIFKFIRGMILCARIARCRNARRVVDEVQLVRFVGLDARTRKTRCVDFELRPVQPCGLRAVIERQQRVCRIDGTVEIKLDFVKVRNVPRRRVGLNVQRVVRHGRLVAAVEDTVDGRSDCTLPVTKIDGVARRDTCTDGIAAVDIAHRAARDGNCTTLGIARSCIVSCIDRTADGTVRDIYFTVCDAARRRTVRNMTTVDVARDGAAGDIRLAVGRRARCTCRREGCTVEIGSRSVRDFSGILSGTARFGLDLGTVGVCRGCTRVQDELVLLGIARSARDGGVFDHAAACIQRRTAARERQLVFLYLVADDGASAPRIRSRRARIACIIVLEAVALEVDFRGCGTVAVRRHVRLVVICMDAPACARIAVARTKVDIAAVLHERQDAVACWVCRETVEVIDVELVPVERCGIAVIQRQEGISRSDVTARRLEVHLVKVGDVARRDTVVDIQRVVRRSRIAAAVELSDGGARSNGIGLAAKVHGVARGRTRARRPAAVDITHGAARDGDNVARGIACRGGMGKIAAVHGAADTAA